MILLNDKETDRLWRKYEQEDPYQRVGWDDVLVKATGKQILKKLQAIYNLPDEGMFHKKMGEFIKELKGEVK